MYIKCPYIIENQVYKFRGDLTKKKKAILTLVINYIWLTWIVHIENWY